MSFRKLKIAWSMFWGLACVLLIALWVRSYRYVEAIRFMRATKASVFQCVSIPGRVAVGTISIPQPWSTFRMSVAEWKKVMASAPPDVPSAVFGGWLKNQSVAQLFIPYWMLTLFILLIGSVPWVGRFSVRTLLIATTLVALLLGLILYATR